MLERRLGVQLLVRQKSWRGVIELTRSGQLLLLEGKDLMDRYRALLEDVRLAAVDGDVTKDQNSAMPNRH